MVRGLNRMLYLGQKTKRYQALLRDWLRFYSGSDKGRFEAKKSRAVVVNEDKGPITEDIILQYLSADLVLYSLWMPSGLSSAAIQVTLRSQVSGQIDTYDESIRSDDVSIACVEYLIRSGTPVFQDAKAQDKYSDALAEKLREGLLPRDARDAALGAICQSTTPILPN